MRLKNEEKQLMRLVLGEIKANGHAALDGETARRVGKLLSELGVRNSVFIGNDRRTRRSILVDLDDKLDYLRVI